MRGYAVFIVRKHAWPSFTTYSYVCSGGCFASFMRPGSGRLHLGAFSCYAAQSDHHRRAREVLAFFTHLDLKDSKLPCIRLSMHCVDMHYTFSKQGDQHLVMDNEEEQP